MPSNKKAASTRGGGPKWDSDDDDDDDDSVQEEGDDNGNEYYEEQSGGRTANTNMRSLNLRNERQPQFNRSSMMTKHGNHVRENRAREEIGMEQWNETPAHRGGTIAFDGFDTPAVSSTSNTSSEEQSYIQHLEATGYHQSAISKNSNVKRYVGTTLFKRLKFIVSGKEMESTGEVAQLVMTHFNVQEKDKLDWWARHKKIVHSALRQRRNNMGMLLRTAFQSKYRQKHSIYCQPFVYSLLKTV